MIKSLIDFAALLFCYCFFLWRRWRGEGRDMLLVKTLMYIYLSFVLFFTLMPVIASLPHLFDHSYAPMNMTPFDDFMNGRGDFIRQIALNVILTVPFGFLWPIAADKKAGFARTVFYTFLLSLVIEILQPLINPNRSADITDLITNTLGGSIGYIFYALLTPAVVPLLRLVRGKTGIADKLIMNE